MEQLNWQDTHTGNSHAHVQLSSHPESGIKTCWILTHKGGNQQLYDTMHTVHLEQKLAVYSHTGVLK